MKTREEITKFLEQPIPRDEVATRSGGGAKRLSYLETWKVIDLLNEAFGNLGWDSETVELTQVPNTKLPTYRAKVRIRALIEVSPGQYLNITKEGCGWGADKSEMNAHEMAVKEAESDALKRAAMKFGKRLGLALYDKTQEHVTDEPSPQAKKGSEQEAPQAAPLAQKERASLPEVPSSKVPREVTDKTIRTTAKVLNDQKKFSMDETKALLSSLGAKRVEDLSDNQAQEVLKTLQEKLNG